MKVPQHTILNSVELKVTASEELQEEVDKELATAKASPSEEKDIAKVLKTNKVSKTKTSSSTLSATNAEEEVQDED